MVPQFFLDRRVHNGLTYENFLQLMKQHTEDPGIEHFENIKLNAHRTERIMKTYEVKPEIKELIAKITTRQIWMVLTEDWCGDSAQNLPVIVKIAECNPLIDLRVLLRDENLDIMDLYLTNGKSRSIPKVVAFDEAGNELFQWGPQPEKARELVQKSKEEGKSKDEYIKDLHLWYGRNRGKDVEEEFLKIIEKLVSASATYSEKS